MGSPTPNYKRQMFSPPAQLDPPVPVTLPVRQLLADLEVQQDPPVPVTLPVLEYPLHLWPLPVRQPLADLEVQQDPPVPGRLWVRQSGWG